MIRRSAKDRVFGPTGRSMLDSSRMDKPVAKEKKPGLTELNSAGLLGMAARTGKEGKLSQMA